MSDHYPETVRRDILYFDHDRPDGGVAEVIEINRNEALSDALGFHYDDPKVVI